MTNIGILGAGRVGTDLARKLSTAGHHVTLGSRNPEDTAARTTGLPHGSPSPTSTPPPAPRTS